MVTSVVISVFIFILQLIDTPKPIINTREELDEWQLQTMLETKKHRENDHKKLNEFHQQRDLETAAEVMVFWASF